MKKSTLRMTAIAGLLCGQAVFGAGAAQAHSITPPCVGCGPEVHVVQSGEWLWKIARADLAQRGINSGELSFVRSRANAIYAANRDVIGSNPNRLRPGMRLVLPPL